MTQDKLKDASPHERYVFKPFVGSSHWWAFKHLENVAPNLKVLDVGPGSGAIGSFLGQRGLKVIDAIEPDESTSTHLRTSLPGIYRQIEASIDPFISRKYDIILLLDVLEHMTDPSTFFANLESMLEKDGFILISVPNIAHWSVRIPLLFGYFEYQSRGLMDRTHFQFFTRHRLKKLIKSVPKFHATELTSSIAPLELVFPKWFCNNAAFRLLSQLRLSAARFLPGLMAYQNLARVERLDALQRQVIAGNFS